MFLHISEFLSEVIHKKGLECKMDELIILKIFQEVVNQQLGQAYSTKVQIKYFKHGVLALISESSMITSEIFANSPVIIDLVNRKIGKNMVEKIIFVN